MPAATQRPSAGGFTTRSVVLATHGMVATSQPLAAQIGIDILKEGGSAVDAAIAANAALGLMEPTGCGIGGDLFALVWDADTKQLLGLNASGRSPQALTLGHLKDLGLERIPAYGPLSVSVPGTVDGWFQLHERFGRLPMAGLLAPAIHYAEEGFPVSPVIAGYWADDVALLKDYPGFAAVFMPNGQAPAPGQLFRNPDLAASYRRLAADGRDAFYRGELATVMVDHLTRHGGFLGRDDLAAHVSEWVAPVSTSYRGYDVWELPPSGQGIAALQILNLLEGFDLKTMGFGSVDYLHLLIEAKKLAFEDRARFYADPQFAAVPIRQLISKQYAAVRRPLINMERANDAVVPGDPLALESSDTVYLAVADAAGNMVSLIQSNYRGMGSGMTPEGLGFVLQDRGELFSLDEHHPNVYAPGKRPFHTIIPAFVTRDGEPLVSFGLMGGAMQPQGHAQIIVNMIDFGMSLQEAGDAPRMRHDGSSEPTGEVCRDGGTVNLECGISAAAIRELRRRGHRVVQEPGGFGGYQAIQRQSGVYLGASESRKDGQAIGY
jgi:gamma-glutamyltranspeptidase/glutathione hydrolase